MKTGSGLAVGFVAGVFGLLALYGIQAAERAVSGVGIQAPAGRVVFRSIAYDPCTQTLRVAFERGGSYAYEGVPYAAYRAFAASESRGAFFNARVRGRYPRRAVSDAGPWGR